MPECWAASRATAEGVAAVEKLLRQCRELAARAHGEPGDLAIHFYGLAMRATGNRSASAMLDRVLDGMSLLATPIGRRRASLDEHGRILSALSAGDGATAAEAMREHLAALGADLQRARLNLGRRLTRVVPLVSWRREARGSPTTFAQRSIPPR